VECACSPGLKDSARFLKFQAKYWRHWKPFKKYFKNLNFSNFFMLGVVKPLLGSQLKMNDSFYI